MNNEIEKQYLNKTHPIDITRTMKFVRDKNILSDNSQKFLNKIMIGTVTGNDKLKAGLPQDIILGHKTGFIFKKTKWRQNCR